jgi:hypothetical protein
MTRLAQPTLLQSNQSRCLESIAELLNNTPGAQILDLGSMCNANLQFFTQFKCKYYAGNMLDSVSPTKNFDAESLQYFLDNLPHDHQYELVLGWDLFNYLSDTDLSLLLDFLNKRCHHNALIHFFLRNQANMPKIPCQFAINSSTSFQITQRSSESISCPRPSLSKIKQHLTDFNSVRSSLLNNGLQENIWAKQKR